MSRRTRRNPALGAADAEGAFTPRRNGAIVGLNNQAETEREHPVIRKPLTGPWITLADQSAISLYWPGLLDLSVAGGTGYLLTYSTDHAADNEVSGGFGIWCPYPGAPVAQCRNLGRIFYDASSVQCETPTFIANPDTQTWHVYYQLKQTSSAKANQVTLLATCTWAQMNALISSGTAIPWTFRGIVLDAPSATSAIPGDLYHHGYFVAWRFAGGWFGVNVGGGTYGALARWHSRDGILWSRSGTARQAMGGAHIMHVAGYDPTSWILKWTESNLIDWRGRMWLIATVGPEAAGLELPGPARICAAPLAADRRGPAAALLDLTPAAQNWESPTTGIDIVGQGASYNGRYYIPYRSNQKTGAISLLEVS